MIGTAAAETSPTRRNGSSFVTKVFYLFAVLAMLSLAISVGGKWLGRSLALAGHTTDTTLHEIVIGTDIISTPANTIRFERQRRDGVADRLDVYLRWPLLDGYSDGARDDFNHADGRRNIVFLSFERRIMSRPMSGRFEPVYAPLLMRPGEAGPGGTTIYELDKKSGFLNEVLVVAPRPDAIDLFVARCLEEEDGETPLAPCERDIHLGKELSLTYRFPREMLGQWGELEAAIQAKAASMLEAGN